jgi:hypothetical protein
MVVRGAVRRAEAAEEDGGAPGAVARSLRRHVWFTMPRRLEPRLWHASRDHQ